MTWIAKKIYSSFIDIIFSTFFHCNIFVLQRLTFHSGLDTINIKMYNYVINLSPCVPGPFWRQGNHEIHDVVLCKNWSCLVLHFQGFAKDVIKLRIWFQWEMLNESTIVCFMNHFLFSMTLYFYFWRCL